MQLFRKKVTSLPAVDAMFVFLRDQVNREDLIADVWASWGHVRKSSPFDSARCAALYLSLERFICDNKPLIVKTAWTSKQALRDAVVQAVSVETLPDYLRLFFVPDATRRELFFNVAAKVLVDIIETTEGTDRVSTIVANAEGNNHGAFAALYREVVSFLGEKTAQARIEETYRFIETAYGAEYLGDFFELCPEELFAKERVSYFSQEKLGVEHKKVEAVEEKNRALEDNKKAMINLLEDARQLEEELKKEKASVEQKVVERTRQLSQEQVKLKASIESIVRAYVFLDTKGTILITNKKLSEFLGDIQGEWTLAKIQEKLGQSFDMMSAYTLALDAQKQTVIKETQVGAKYFDIHVSPVLVDGKDLIGVLLLIGDITERKIMERSRDEFFSIASHELRTPLTAIRGNTSMILDNYASALTDPDLKEMITDVHDSSIRLIDIVNDFLTTSRLEQGRMEFRKEAFDLTTLIHNALKEYQVTGSRAHIALTFEEPETPLPAVFADADRVRQVLINLIGNGLKFTETGSVTVSVRQTDGLVQVSVTDTGRGIPIANQSLLFHKFQQAGSSILTRDTTKGTGLGLYISKLIIEGIGGKIWLAQSQESKGSTFTFTLPIMK